MAAPVSDFPAPDSPTTPRISPGAISNDTSSSATSVPGASVKATARWRTDSRARLMLRVAGPVIAGAD